MSIVFWLAVGWVVYSYLGYPLLLAMFARFRPRPVRRAAITPRVSVILAVHDGAEWLERKLASFQALDYPADRLELILVSDGSRDATRAIAERHAGGTIHIVINHERQGKAACLNQAVALAGGEILVFTDVRQRLAPDALRRLVSAFADPQVAAVSGELMLEPDSQSGLSGGIDLYWRLEKWLRHNEGRVASVIGVTGALYGLRRHAYRPIPAETLLDDVLIPMQAVLDGGRVVFERGALAYDIPSSSARREQRRKIRTIAGNYQLLRLCPVLLNPGRNPVWWQFVSHKLTRLAVPAALLAAGVSNAWLAMHSTFYGVLLLGQVAVYASAFIGIARPVWQRRRLVRLTTTFVLLNWFAVLGFWQFTRMRGGHPTW